MARNSTIGDGGNYPTLTLWEASINRGSNGEETGECIDAGNFGETFTINAGESGTDRIILTAASGVRHDGTAESGVWNGGTQYQQPCRVNADYVTVEWMGIRATASRSLEIDNADNCCVCNCVMWNPSETAGAETVKINSSDDLEIHECYVFSNHATQSDGLIMVSGSDGCLINNVTVYNCTNGFSMYNSTVDARLVNCIAIDCDTSDYAGTYGTCDYNIDEDGGAPGATTYTKTSAIFEDDTVTDPNLDMASGQDTDGTSSVLGSYNPGVDIHGTTRVSWTIGAFEVAAGGGGGVEIFRRRIEGE